MISKLLTPIGDRKLSVLVHSTMGVCLIAALMESGVIQHIGEIELARSAVLALTGILVCLSLCKTLGHEELPKSYLRFGSYIMSFGYSVYVVVDLVGEIQSHFAVV